MKHFLQTILSNQLRSSCVLLPQIWHLMMVCIIS